MGVNRSYDTSPSLLHLLLNMIFEVMVLNNSEMCASHHTTCPSMVEINSDGLTAHQNSVKQGHVKKSKLSTCRHGVSMQNNVDVNKILSPFQDCVAVIWPIHWLIQE